jgi:endonuclease YncB( thermonuclease family)
VKILDKKQLFAFISCLLFTCFAFASKEPKKIIKGKVVNISDGDTITVLTKNNQNKKIRLYGIDAPERKQAYGNLSKKHLTKMVAGKQVEVKIYDTDKYGRSVGVVSNKKKNINKQMVKDGYAWNYKKYNKLSDRKDYERAERNARGRKAGLWKDKKPVNPSRQRRSRKTKY